MGEQARMVDRLQKSVITAIYKQMTFKYTLPYENKQHPMCSLINDSFFQLYTFYNACFAFYIVPVVQLLAMAVELTCL